MKLFFSIIFPKFFCISLLHVFFGDRIFKSAIGFRGGVNKEFVVETNLKGKGCRHRPRMTKMRGIPIPLPGLHRGPVDGHSLSMGAHGPPLTPTKTMSKLKYIQSMKDSSYIDSPMAKAATMLVMEESFPGFKTQLHAIRPGGGRARESEVTTLNPLSLLRGVPNIFSPC